MAKKRKRSSCTNTSNGENLNRRAKKQKMDHGLSKVIDYRTGKSLCSLSEETCDFCDEEFCDKVSALVHNADHVIIPLAREKFQGYPNYYSSQAKTGKNLKQSENLPIISTKYNLEILEEIKQQVLAEFKPQDELKKNKVIASKNQDVSQKKLNSNDHSNKVANTSGFQIKNNVLICGSKKKVQNQIAAHKESNPNVSNRTEDVTDKVENNACNVVKKPIINRIMFEEDLIESLEPIKNHKTRDTKLNKVQPLSEAVLNKFTNDVRVNLEKLNTGINTKNNGVGTFKHDKTKYHRPGPASKTTNRIESTITKPGFNKITNNGPLVHLDLRKPSYDDDDDDVQFVDAYYINSSLDKLMAEIGEPKKGMSDISNSNIVAKTPTQLPDIVQDVTANCEMTEDSNHYSELVKPKDHKCKYCKLEFTNRFRMVKHMKVHLRIKLPAPHICVVCEQSSRVIQDPPLCLRCSHKWAKHKNARYNLYQIFECDICAERFLTSQCLLDHMRAHRVEFAQLCEVCHVFVRASTRASYNRIGRIVDVNPHHRCQQCAKRVYELTFLHRVERKLPSSEMSGQRLHKRPMTNQDRLKNIRSRFKKLNM